MATTEVCVPGVPVLFEDRTDQQQVTGDEIEFRFSTLPSVPESKTAGLQLAGAVVTES